MLLSAEIENFGLSALDAAANGTPPEVAQGSGVLEMLCDNNSNDTNL
jgi:hypothetical protein